MYCQFTDIELTDNRTLGVGTVTLPQEAYLTQIFFVGNFRTFLFLGILGIAGYAWEPFYIGKKNLKHISLWTTWHYIYCKEDTCLQYELKQDRESNASPLLGTCRTHFCYLCMCVSTTAW